MQRVEDKQSGCVGVKFLTETVLKLQNTIMNKKVTIKKKFQKKISSDSIPKLILYKLQRGVFL